MLDALELWVLRTDCSSYMRWWTRDKPRGVRLLDVGPSGCSPGDRERDTGPAELLREAGHSVRVGRLLLPLLLPALLLVLLAAVATFVVPFTTEAFG